MNITQLKQCILLCRAARITSFTWGERGLGKSSVHKEVGKERRAGFLDFRCSQIEASDLRGLPDKDNGVTVYCPPADLPRGHSADEICPACEPEDTPLEDKIDYDWFQSTHPGLFCKGILFLDEPNRAEDDVLQAVFQLVLDRKVGLYTVPEGWSIHCAGNFGDGDYMVNSFNDAAFLDRFCHLTLSTGQSYMDDWSRFMLDTHGVTGVEKILQFTGFNEEHLLGSPSGGMNFTIQPSPRSWDAVARIEKVCLQSPVFDESDSSGATPKGLVIAGMIGQSLAQQYLKFTCKVTPAQIMDIGLTDRILRDLSTLTRNAQVGLVWALGAMVKNRKKDRVVMNRVLDFMQWVATNSERDLAVSLGKALLKEETKHLSGPMLSNPELLRIAKQLNMKTSSAGELHWVNLIAERPELHEMMFQVANGIR